MRVGEKGKERDRERRKQIAGKYIGLFISI